MIQMNVSIDIPRQEVYEAIERLIAVQTGKQFKVKEISHAYRDTAAGGAGAVIEAHVQEVQPEKAGAAQ